MKLHLSIPGHYCMGLGDCITWAWISKGGTPLTFWAEGRNREILELLGCTLEDSAEGAIDPHDCYNLELRERGKRPRIEIWAERLGISCEPNRPTVGIEKRGFMKRRVALCPHTHFRQRAWPAAYWVDLNWQLRARNIEPVLILETKDETFKDPCGPTMAYYGYPMKQVAQMLQGCAVVVSNDSMPAHLAGTIGRPTIAIMGPTKSTVFAHISNVLPLYSQLVDCGGCHFGHPFRAACDMMCQSLSTLLPNVVADAVETIVNTLGQPDEKTAQGTSRSNSRFSPKGIASQETDPATQIRH